MTQISYAGKTYNSKTGRTDLCLDILSSDGTSVKNIRCKPLRVSEGALSSQSNGAYFLLKAGINTGGATSMTTSDTVVSTSYSLVRKKISSLPAYQNGTLANGTDGQVLTFLITEVEVGGTFTLTPATASGFTSLVFEAVDDMVTFLYVDDTVGWILLSQGSVQKI